MYGLNDPIGKVDRTGGSASSLFDGRTGYAYDGTAFYDDPTARPPAVEQPFGQRAAYAVAQVFADLDSPNPGTQAAALLKLSGVGIVVAVPVALALPEGAVAAAGSTLIGGATAIGSGLTWLVQKAQSALPAVSRAPVTPTVTRGTSVIGRYPDYLRLAEELGARRFNVPIEVWNRMTPAQQWIANQKYLDRAIARGDIFRLANPLSEVRAGSATIKEIQYLLSKGYTLTSDGTRLVPPGFER